MPARSLVPCLLASVLAMGCAGGQYERSEVATGEVALSDAEPSACGMIEDMCRVLAQHDALWGEPIETLSPTGARRMPTLADAVRAMIADEGRSIEPTSIIPGVGSIDRTIRGAAGPLPARVYTPSGPGPFPVIVYFHGGGFVLADKDAYDFGARALAERTRAIVVSVDYRLAPERPFPAAHEDAIAAYRWVLANAGRVDGDSSRVALAGESAGGTLAIATAIAARDEGLPEPRHVLAVYPVAGTDTTTPSYREYASAQPLGRESMGWFMRYVISSPKARNDPRLNLLAADLHGLPPVTIVAAEVDPLRWEGERLAERLLRAGVDVERRQWDGVAHEFFGLGPVLREAREAQGFAASRLRVSFASR